MVAITPETSVPSEVVIAHSYPVKYGTRFYNG
jgi:hypothetical protein